MEFAYVKVGHQVKVGKDSVTKIPTVTFYETDEGKVFVFANAVKDDGELMYIDLRVEIDPANGHKIRYDWGARL